MDLANSSSGPRTPTDARLLILLNPGRMSRHWLLGISRAAERMGILFGTLELAQIWQAIQQAGPNHATVRAQAAEQIRSLCRRERITHVLSYTQNGVFDFGVTPDPASRRPQGLFPSLGINHILLWSDHPNWASSGAALSEPMASLLDHPHHHHFVKSPVAASEIRAVLRWRNVHAINMGEDTSALTPDHTALESTPQHDAVLIMGDCAPIPTSLEPFLDEDDPDPRTIMRTLLRDTLAGTERTITALSLGATNSELALALAADLARLRIEQPHMPFWRLSECLASDHRDAIAILRESPDRWFRFIHSLHALTGWRRFFWPAWLARRTDAAVYGSPASRMGLPDRDDAAWIDNDAMPAIYARGACAININAAHDETGMTHKPFQIACSGVPMLHHDTEGITNAFDRDTEVFTWSRGPELREAVRRIRADQALRTSMGEQARARCERDHDWQHRLSRMLELAVQQSTHAAVA